MTTTPVRDSLSARRVMTVVVVIAGIAAAVYGTSGILYFTRVLHVSADRMGIVLSVAGAASIAAGAATGWASDRFGPRWALGGSLTLAALATVTLLWAHNGLSLFLIVPTVSAMHAAVHIAMATMVNHIVSEEVNEFRGRVRAILNIGLAVGAGAAGVIAQWNSVFAYRTAFAATAVLLLMVVIPVTWLPDPAAPETDSGAGLRTVLHDRPYLTLATVDGILALLHSIQQVAIPLWIITATLAPRWTIASADLANMMIVVLFQAAICRKIADPSSGGRAYRYAGWVVLTSCAILSATPHQPWLAVTAIGVGAAVLACGELWHTAAGFELSNRLAPPDAVGRYLGVFGTGLMISLTVGPALVTWLCIGVGRTGWLILGGLILTGGLAAPRLTGWARSTRPADIPDLSKIAS